MNEDNKVMIQNWRRDPTILQEGPQERGMGEITVERIREWRDQIERAIRNGEIEDDGGKRERDQAEEW
jgi:hypothetical protein